VVGVQRPSAIGWEGNRMSGVALAMRHRLIHLRVQWPGKGRWAPRLSSIRSTTASLPLPGLMVLGLNTTQSSSSTIY